MFSVLLVWFRHLQGIRAEWLNRFYYPWRMRGTGRRIVREASEWCVIRKGRSRPGCLEVLIVGDSIARDYFPALVKKTGESAVLSLWATSRSVGDSTLPGEVGRFLARSRRSYALLFFSNGLHGWGYTEEEYARGLPEWMEALRAGAPQARLTALAATPVSRSFPGGPTPDRIAARNALVQAEATRRELEFMELPARAEEQRDGLHFTAAGANRQAEAVAAMLRKFIES